MMIDTTVWKSRPQMTNADRVRAMTDEELAEAIETIASCDKCPIFAYPDDACSSCRDGWLNWLKQEFKGGE